MAQPATPQSVASSIGEHNPGSVPPGLDQETGYKILSVLQRAGCKNAEEALRREMGMGSGLESRPVSAMASAETPAPELASYESLKDEPSNYILQYEALVNLVNTCLDRYKAELGCLLWPVFAHMYLELMGVGLVDSAHELVTKFGNIQEDYQQPAVQTMLRIQSKDAIPTSHLLTALRENMFCIRISRDQLAILTPFVKQYRIIMEIMKSRITVETMDTAPRSADVMQAVKGSWLGEAMRSANKTRVMHGIIREDFSAAINAEAVLAQEEESKKKSKAKARDAARDKASKKDANAPNPTRIPLPEWSDQMKQDKARSALEAQKMPKYSPENLPSVCFYTVLNANEDCCSCEFCDDSTLMAGGFGDSSIHVWAMGGRHSRVKPNVDKELEDDAEMMMTTDEDTITLRGHHGPVYSSSFSPDKRLLLSASEDSTVRLWSLQTWTNLAVHKIGGYPVWDVDFSNRGYYFCTGSADRMATLWTTDKLQPLRVFCGHLSDVNAVCMHPNCNYVISGGEDCTVRMWDVLNGQCVRCFTGHKGAVLKVRVSSDGKYIASGGADGRAIVWDVGMGRMLAPSPPSIDDHMKPIHSVEFSRDNAILAYGGANKCVRMLNLASVTSESEESDLSISQPNLYRPVGAGAKREDLAPLSLFTQDHHKMVSLPSYSNDVASPEMEIAGDAIGGNFFADSKSRHADLKAMLDSSKDSLKMEAMKRIINMVAKGKDASELFPAVVKNVAAKNLEVKKLVYVYLVRYAEEQQDLALLSISTFQRALKDPNQLIRSSALRVLSSIRVPMIVPIMMLAIKESMRDMSSFVRKTAAHAIPKLYSLDPEQRDQLVEVIDHLLADRTTLVVGSAVYAFEELCPERIDLIHKHYRKLCQLMIDVDEWGQVTIINMLTRYARTQFIDPNAQHEPTDESNDNESDDDSGSDILSQPKRPLDPDLRMLLLNCKALLNSRNSAVVVAVSQMYYHLAPSNEMGVVAKSLIRLLRGHREVQSVVLTNIATISAKRSVQQHYAISKNMFDPFLKSFFVRSSDPTHIKLLKLEVLTNLANQTNISIILRELQTYVRTHDQELAASAIDAIGRCASNIEEVTDACLSGLVTLMSSKNATVVAQSVVVMKRLLQSQPGSHQDIIGSMAKLVDTVSVPAARASIVWLIGEYCQYVPLVAPDVLRKMAKSFVQEDETVKQQVLNLAVKLLLTNPEQTSLLTQYVFTLARYDHSYDLRDRARLLKALAMPCKQTALSDAAKTIFLSPKPAPVIESTFKDRDQYQLGTLSHYLNQRCNGYHDLPEFPENAPDHKVRDVPGWGLPEPTKDKKLSALKAKIKKGFYSEEEEESEGEDESGEEEDSGSEEESDASLDEEQETSEDSSESSTCEEEQTPQNKQNKLAKKTPAPPTSNNNMDLLLDLDFGGTEGSAEGGGGASTAPLMPVMSMTKQSSPVKTYSDTWTTAPPQCVPSRKYELLNKVSGGGLTVHYRFPRSANLYASSMCSVEIQAHNTTNEAITDLKIVHKSGSIVKVEGLNVVKGELGIGESVSHRLGVEYGDTTQPATVELSVSVEGRLRKHTLIIQAPVGEQLVPILLSPEQFRALRGRLGGMNETSGKLILGDVDRQSLCALVYDLANVIEVTCSEDLCFCGETLSTRSPVLITFSHFTPGVETKLTVNCEKMVVGSMLFKSIKQIIPTKL